MASPLSDDEIRALAAEARRRGTDDPEERPLHNLTLGSLLTRLANALEQSQPPVRIASKVIAVRRGSLTLQSEDGGGVTFDGWAWSGHVPAGTFKVGDEVLVGIGKVPK